MKRYNRHKLKKDIKCYILSFILMLSLISLSLVSLGTYSMMSVHGVLNAANRVDYYDYLKSDMMQQAYDMAIPFGIDQILKKSEVKEKESETTGAEEESTEKKLVTKSNVEIEDGIIFMEEVFSVEKIENDVKAVLKAKLDGKDYEVDTKQMEDKILELVKKESKSLSAEEEQSIQAYSEQLMEVYKSKVVLPSLPIIVWGIQFFQKIIWFVVPISLFVSLLCIFLIMSMRTETYRGLRFVAYGTLGAGATLATVFAAMISDGSIYRMNISSAYTRRFFTFLIGHEMLMQVFAGILMLLSGAIMVFTIARMKFRGRA